MRILLLILLIACRCQAAVADTAPNTVVDQSTAAAQDIPYKKDNSGGDVSLIRVVVVMGLLLGLAGGALVLLKRSALAGKLGMAESKFIRLIELKRLSPRLNVYLIAIKNRHYVLAQSGESISILEHHEADGFNVNE